MTHRGATFQNIVWLVAERMARVAAAALVLAIVARHLGPEQFGTLNYALLLLGLAMPVATLCFDAVAIGELVRLPAEAPRILGSAFGLRAGAGLACGILFLLLGMDRRWGADTALLVPVSLMLLLQAFEAPELWFQSRLLARWTTLARIGALAGGAVLKLELVRRGAHVSGFLWAQLAENACYAILVGIAFHRSGGRIGQWSWCRETAGRLARLAWPLAAAGALVGLYLRLDQLLVQQILSATDAGTYFAASRVTDMAMVAGGAVGSSLFPDLAGAHARGSAEFRERLGRVFDLLTGMGWAAALFLTFAAPWVVGVLFGTAYSAAAPVLVIKGWACVLLFSGIARGQYIVLTGATRANLASVCIGLVAQAVAAVLLMPKFGGPGAAAGSVVAAIVSGWVTSFTFRSLRECAPAQTRGLLVPFRPRQWPACLKLVT